jgi:hypothetical protein
MPTIFSAATADLPAARAATGSAVVSMARQIGITLGVSLFVATLGTPIGTTAMQDAFRRVWWGVAVIAVLAAGAASQMTTSRARRAAATVRVAIVRFFARTHLGPVENYVAR